MPFGRAGGYHRHEWETSPHKLALRVLLGLRRERGHPQREGRVAAHSHGRIDDAGKVPEDGLVRQLELEARKQRS